MEREREHDLAIAALAGDKAARDELVLSIKAFIWQHAIRLERRHKKLAEDLAQVGIASVVKAFDRFDPERNRRFISYFGIVAIRAMQDYAWHDGLIRLAHKYWTKPAKYVAAEKVRDDTMLSFSKLDSDADALPGRSKDPADIVADNEFMANIQLAIQTLPRQQMRVMRLMIEGLSNPEIKVIIGWSRQRVKQLSDAACKNLREYFNAKSPA